MLKKARRLTRPAPATISPTRPESAKTASSPMNAPFRGQGRSFAADPRFTFHPSRFMAAGSEARTPLADLLSILLVSASDSVAMLSASPRSTQTGGVRLKGMRCLRSMEKAGGDATAG